MQELNSTTKNNRFPLWSKVLLAIFGFMVITLLASFQMSGHSCLFERRELRLLDLLPVNLIYFICWGLLFFPIRKISLALLNRVQKWALILGLHAVLAGIFSLLHMLMLYTAYQMGLLIDLFGFGVSSNLRALAYRWMGSNLYTYLIIVGVLYLGYFYRTHKEKELAASQLQTRMAQIQLHSLKTQLQPHFLFNALNTISAYIKKDPGIAIRMLARLSDLLRLTLDTGSKMEIALQDELHMVENYLELEQLRFSDRLKVVYDITPGCGEIEVPTLILQPLVENAVRHGISKTIDGGTVTISAHLKENNLVLRVTDDGPGFSGSSNDDLYTKGIGLSNTRERLERRYGSTAQINIDTLLSPGFAVQISIPCPQKGCPEREN